MISYIIPTRNRPDDLAQTLAAIGELGDHAGGGGAGAEVVVFDNGSEAPVQPPRRLASGVPVKVLRSPRNHGAAARNLAAEAAEGTWLVMLDDDSQPLGTEVLGVLREAPRDVLAVGAEIFLPPPNPVAARVLPARVDWRTLRHEQGGLPEVFVGCGVAVRRAEFLKLGGYDPTFDFYAEEYDLAARMLLSGGRVGFDRRFRVLHRKVATGRNFGRIVRRLVRNNAWVAARYAPPRLRGRAVREHVSRYAAIARREGALPGYAAGLVDLSRTLLGQPRFPMPEGMWDRFTGLAHARAALQAAHAERPLGRVALVARGKHDWAVERAALELGVAGAADWREAETLIVATMSPGPMLDAAATLAGRAPGTRVVLPWLGAGAGAGAGSGADVQPAVTAA